MNYSDFKAAGESTRKEVTGNEINIKEGAVVTNVYGGKAGNANGQYTSTPKVDNNIVNISGGRVKGYQNQGGEVYGGFSYDGEVCENKVNISGGYTSNNDYTPIIDRYVYGGYAVKSSGYASNYSVHNNSVTMDGGLVGVDVLGAGSQTANLTENTATIIAGKVGGSVYGAKSYIASSGSGKVTKNYVYLGDKDDSSKKPLIGGDVYGGRASHNDASENEVHMYYGEAGYGSDLGTIYGGASDKGSADKNKVYIYNGTVNRNVVGGSGSGTGNTAKENEVTIAGGTVKGNVIGGSSADSEGNKICITGGELTGGSSYATGETGHYIAGGITTDSGKAINNTVSISGGTINKDIAIYGGYLPGKGNANNLIKDNELNLTKYILSNNPIYNFDRANLDNSQLNNNTLTNVLNINLKDSQMTDNKLNYVNVINAKSGSNSIKNLSAARSDTEEIGLNELNVLEGATLTVEDCSVDAFKISSLLNSGTLTLKSGQLYANNFTAEDGSTFNVYANNITGYNAAVVGIDGAVNISDSANLFINDAVKDTRYNILQGKSITGTDEDSPTYSFNTEKIKATDELLEFVNKYDAERNIYYVITKIEDNVIPDHDDEPDILPEELTTVGAVSHATQSALLFMADAVLDHVAPAIELHPEPETEEDTHLWVHCSHSKEEATDRMLGSKSTSYDLQLNSYTVGRDVYQHDTDTVGIALSYAKGDAVGLGGEARTENDAEYYGFSVYGRKDDGKFTYLSDLSYIHGENDLKQRNLSRTFTGDTKSDAISLGFTAMERVDRGEHRFVPYAGLRYLNVSNKDYYDSFGMKHESDTQHILLAPVGVRYTAEIPSGDWMVKPLVDLRYTWSMGDRETNETISYGGASTSYDYLTRDSGLFSARLGVTAEKKAFAVGLAYERQVGDTVRADRFLANMNFKF